MRPFTTCAAGSMAPAEALVLNAARCVYRHNVRRLYTPRLVRSTPARMCLTALAGLRMLVHVRRVPLLGLRVVVCLVAVVFALLSFAPMSGAAPGWGVGWCAEPVGDRLLLCGRGCPKRRYGLHRRSVRLRRSPHGQRGFALSCRWRGRCGTARGRWWVCERCGLRRCGRLVHRWGLQ